MNKPKFQVEDVVNTVKTGGRWYCGGNMKERKNRVIQGVVVDRECGYFYTLDDGYSYHETELCLENMYETEPKKSTETSKSTFKVNFGY